MKSQHFNSWIHYSLLKTASYFTDNGPYVSALYQYSKDLKFSPDNCHDKQNK
jgi:hypothetical protein